MYNQQMGNGYPQPVQNKPALKISLPQNPMLKNLALGLIIAAAVAIIGCFLPYLSAEAGGIKESTNFFSNDGKMADGIFVIVLGALSIGTVLMGKYILPVIFQGISALLMLYHMFTDLSSSEVAILKMLGGKASWGIGFYVVVLGVAASLIAAIMLFLKTKTASPVQAPVMPMGGIPQAPVNPQPQVQNKCPYCGAPKTGGDFCPSCGAKY